MNPIEKLNQLELSLPTPSNPGGSYVSCNIRGNHAFIAIQFPIVNGQFQYQGRLGQEISTEDGIKAMELCALNVLSQVHHKIGFEKIEGLNHIEAVYQASPNWDDAPLIVDGASDLFVQVLGEKGKHSRSIMGVADLPRNFCVGLTTSFTLKQ